VNRSTIRWWFSLALMGCSSPVPSTTPTADRPVITASGIFAVPPDLVTEARYLRSIGGIVVRAELRSRGEITTQLTPGDYPAGSGNSLAQDFANGQFRVTDALGESVDSTITVRAPIGSLRLVDASGAPVPAEISGDQTLLRDQMFMPESGEFVLFLGPVRSDGARLLNWRAVVVGNMVSGANTVLSRDEPLASLRRP